MQFESERHRLDVVYLRLQDVMHPFVLGLMKQAEPKVVQLLALRREQACVHEYVGTFWPWALTVEPVT